MARDTLTGTRIRERRSMLGLRQTDLARQVGISASYLNLIEHNRRRIGGKLLNAIAAELDVEVSLLSEGAEAALIATLREAAADMPGAQPELARIDEFAGRFPGWAALVADAHRRIRSLEHTAATLTDRLAHDPHLAASMHEVLSQVTAIRSTASILAETKGLEPEWQARFQRNLNDDSQKLAQSSQALVRYLDSSADAGTTIKSPQEEVEQVLADHGYRFDAFEGEGEGEEGGDTSERIAQYVAGLSGLTSAGACELAATALAQYHADAQRLPRAAFSSAVKTHGADPEILARAFRVEPAAVFRRLVVMGPDVLPDPVGLVICDSAGMLLFRRQIDGFPLPRYSAACPKWPLFQALNRPLAAIRRTLVQAGREGERFDCYAITEPVGPVRFDTDPLYRSYMLIRRADRAGASDADREVGSTCRICPSTSCTARREPSIVEQGI